MIFLYCVSFKLWNKWNRSHCVLCVSNVCLFVCLFVVEIATLTRENGRTCIKVLKQKEVDVLIKKHEAEEAKVEKAKKEKEQKEKDK